MWYVRSYVIPEGRPLEFRIDTIEASADNVSTAIGLEVQGNPENQGYVVHRTREFIGVVKYRVPHGVLWLQRSTIPEFTDPATLIWSFEEEGDNIVIGVKLVARDDPEQVVFELPPVIDTPGPDRAYNGEVENAGLAPCNRGPSMFVVFGMAVIGGSTAPVELVLDNLVCSEGPSPTRLEIGRELDTFALAWQGSWTLFEADALPGPWRPYPETIDAYRSFIDRSCDVPLKYSARFFRLAPGYVSTRPFDGTEDWTIYPAGEGYYKPELRRDGETYSIEAHGDLNEDYVILDSGGNSGWQRDSVVSIDIVAWDGTMEDAAFGILHRVQPDQQVWHGTGGLPEFHYAGRVTFKKAEAPSESALTIAGPGGELLAAQTFPAMDPEKDYRLRFWAVGDELTLELFECDAPDNPVATCYAVDDRIPVGMQALHGTKSSGDTYGVTIARYYRNSLCRSAWAYSPR